MRIHFKNICKKDKILCHIFLLITWLFLTFLPALVQAKTIVVSIPVLAGMIQPLLNSNDKVISILKPNQSPHDFQLKPSQFRILQRADLVLGIGTQVDSWLNKALHGNRSSPTIFMNNLPNIKYLYSRKKIKKDNKVIDPHLWISSYNAIIFITAVAKHLNIQPNKLNSWIREIHKTDSNSSKILRGLKNKPFMVLHDSFQYFERTYALNNVGIIRTDHNLAMNIKHKVNLHQIILKKNVKCFIKEPQFIDRYIYSLVNKHDVKVISINPIGNKTMPYNKFLWNITDKYYKCLVKN